VSKITVRNPSSAASVKTASTVVRPHRTATVESTDPLVIAAIAAGKLIDTTAAAAPSSSPGTYRGVWTARTDYAKGDTVTAPDGTVQSAKAAFTSGTTFDPSKWTPTETVGHALIERSATGGTVIAKPLGDGFGGVKDLSNDDVVGFLFHLHTGPNSGGSAAAIGVGTDDGAGTGVLVSHKNAGVGVRVVHNPSASGNGLGVTGYAKNAFPARFDNYVGALGVAIATMPGEGFTGGQVLASNLQRLIVPGANFTGADVGLTVSQTTSTGRRINGVVDSIVIPAGTTIASVIDSQTVQLSQPASGPVEGANVFVGRPMIAGQNLLRFFDNATQIGGITRSQGQMMIPWEVLNGTGAGRSSNFLDGTRSRFYAFVSGSNYVRSDVEADTNGIRLRSFAAAAKGSESGPVTGVDVRNVAGAPAISFLGAAPTVKAAIAGSRGGNAALAALLTELAAKGLITDSTTP
jgi:hypothetical protein